MNLRLVTWDGDLTQFLVEADNNIEAVDKAIQAHWEYDKDNWGKRNSKDEDDAEMIAAINDRSLYAVENVDLSLLAEICQRIDCWGRFGEAIVFG